MSFRRADESLQFEASNFTFFISPDLAPAKLDALYEGGKEGYDQTHDFGYREIIRAAEAEERRRAKEKDEEERKRRQKKFQHPEPFKQGFGSDPISVR